MKTEAEARKCWCPFVRLIDNRAGVELAGYNRDNIHDKRVHSNCIASECMAWRKGRFANKKRRGGFCGLAGKP